VYSQDPIDFFIFQAVVGVIETLIFAARAYQQMPTPNWHTGFDWALVKPILPFAANMSGAAILWIVLTQIDKVLLSELLPLHEYGYFSLVALITTGIMMLSNPVAQTLLPRLTVLMAEGRRDDMHALFLAAHRFICTFMFPLAALIALHADSMVYAWSGDQAAAQWCRSILPWYSLGSAIMAASAFQFYLQYAYGQMRLHMWYSVVSALITVPVMFVSIHYYGAMGAALAWFILRLVSFAIWPAIVHNKLAPGVHGQWLRDVIRISVMTGAGLAISEPIFRMFAAEDRLSTFMGLAISGLITLAVVAASYKPLVTKISILFSKLST
jgi:O-antigen/teichoic acid export membrane protein